MPSAQTVRYQIEAALSARIPSALTPTPGFIRATASVGIPEIDALLSGGLPLGAITEMIGPEGSGRTAAALSFLSQITRQGRICAWIDVADTLRPDAAAASGVDLKRLLWVRCGAPETHVTQRNVGTPFSLPEKYMIPPPHRKGLHGGGFGPHPRNEQKGLSAAVSALFPRSVSAPQSTDPQSREVHVRYGAETVTSHAAACRRESRTIAPSQYDRLDQGLRVADLLLQAGGFSAIVLDMGSTPPIFTSRIPLAMWFRYRAAAERTQASVVLLSQHGCAKSSAGLVLHFEGQCARSEERSVFTGINHRLRVKRQRFCEVSNVIPLRKPPQRAEDAVWNSRSVWAGSR